MVSSEFAQRGGAIALVRTGRLQLRDRFAGVLRTCTLFLHVHAQTLELVYRFNGNRPSGRRLIHCAADPAEDRFVVCFHNTRMNTHNDLSAFKKPPSATAVHKSRGNDEIQCFLFEKKKEGFGHGAR